MYDLIYGESAENICNKNKLYFLQFVRWSENFLSSCHVWIRDVQASAHWYLRQRSRKMSILLISKKHILLLIRIFLTSQSDPWQDSDDNTEVIDKMKMLLNCVNQVFMSVSSLVTSSWKTTSRWPGKIAWLTPDWSETSDPALTDLWLVSGSCHPMFALRMTNIWNISETNLLT